MSVYDSFKTKLKALRNGDQVGVSWHSYGFHIDTHGVVEGRKASGVFKVRFMIEGSPCVSSFSARGVNKNILGSRLNFSL